MVANGYHFDAPVIFVVGYLVEHAGKINFLTNQMLYPAEKARLVEVATQSIRRRVTNHSYHDCSR